jgi:hypothetical protein
MKKDELDRYIRFNNNNNESKNIEGQWRNINNSIYNAVEKILEYKKKLLRKKWMTSEIFDRKKTRERNIQEYNHKHASQHMSQSKSSKKYMADKIM